MKLQEHIKENFEYTSKSTSRVFPFKEHFKEHFEDPFEEHIMKYSKEHLQEHFKEYFKEHFKEYFKEKTQVDLDKHIKPVVYRSFKEKLTGEGRNIHTHKLA